jgi:hypothetical protein
LGRNFLAPEEEFEVLKGMFEPNENEEQGEEETA